MVKDKAEIALIYPHVYKPVRNAMPFHPLGIAQLSALLRQRGMDTLVQDHTFMVPSDALDELLDLRPRIVGISIMLTMVENAVSLAGKIRDMLPGVLLVCGGPMPTLRPDQFDHEFDVVFRGEAACSFPSFCEDYLNSSSLDAVLKEFTRYPGIHAYSAGGSRVLSAPVTHAAEEELDLLPIPDRSDYAHSLYRKFWQEREGYSPAAVMTTFGCPHACDFCSKPVFGNLYRKRSMDRIMEEIHDIRSMGYGGLWIADDCFTLDCSHVNDFCRRMIEEGMHMGWTCLSRTDGIPEETADLMRRAGCRKIFFGLESGSNEVLRLMNKKTTVEKAERTVRLISAMGIKTAGFFMVGYPGESCETIERTLDWALRLPLDEISFTIPFPLPDTPLFKKVRGIRKEADWVYANENRMIYQSDFDEGYLNKRIEETYARFEAGKRNQDNGFAF